MDTQLLVVGILVAAAAAYLARSAWQTVRGKKACGSGCGGKCVAEPAKPGRVALPQVK
jgi:hypothetical protein